MDIDVLGSYNTLKATLPHLVTSAAKHKSDGKTPCPSGTGGRIIFISATIHYTTMPLQTHVSVAKAGVEVLSNSTSVEFGPRGVTSNVIAPGPIGGTEGMQRLARSEDVTASIKNIPLGRWGTVKEIADATVYLFSDAGNYVNGQTLVGESFHIFEFSSHLWLLMHFWDSVDGAAWRTSSGPGSGFKYPDFLLSDEMVTGVKGGKKSKL